MQSLLGQHGAALATIDALRLRNPESRDAINGPQISFARSVILVRAGRPAEGYAEVRRLLRVRFGSPLGQFLGYDPAVRVLLKDDRQYDEVLNHPPRL